MAKAKSTQLDQFFTPAGAFEATPFAEVQNAGVLLNALIVVGAFPVLTAALDTDTLQNSDYASVAGTPTIADIVTKFNALLARLDADTTVTDTDYVSKCTVSQLSELSAQFQALLLKLDRDAGVPATTYRSGLATWTTLLRTPLDG